MNLPLMAGQPGTAYAIPILYVQAVPRAHLLAFRLPLRIARSEPATVTPTRGVTPAQGDER
jgi:hypothetical protein